MLHQEQNRFLRPRDRILHACAAIASNRNLPHGADIALHPVQVRSR